MPNFDSKSFANAFWDQHAALVMDRNLEYSPATAQAAAILVLANIIHNRQERD